MDKQVLIFCLVSLIFILFCQEIHGRSKSSSEIVEVPVTESPEKVNQTIQNCDISDKKKVDLKDCINVTKCSINIDATKNEIRSIDDDTLKGCSVLELLDLRKNMISEISLMAFESQIKLKELRLMENKLKKLTPGIFDPLVKLEKLWLQNNEIEVIEENIFAKNKKLNTLYLNINKIVAVGPNVIDVHLNWREITLYGNPCMSPKLQSHNGNQLQDGFFYSKASGYRTWKNTNKCVLFYDMYMSIYSELMICREMREKQIVLV
jgi:hypothetical protein